MLEDVLVSGSGSEVVEVVDFDELVISDVVESG